MKVFIKENKDKSYTVGFVNKAEKFLSLLQDSKDFSKATNLKTALVDWLKKYEPGKLTKINLNVNGRTITLETHLPMPWLRFDGATFEEIVSRNKFVNKFIMEY